VNDGKSEGVVRERWLHLIFVFSFFWRSLTKCCPLLQCAMPSWMRNKKVEKSKHKALRWRWERPLKHTRPLQVFLHLGEAAGGWYEAARQTPVYETEEAECEILTVNRIHSAVEIWREMERTSGSLPSKKLHPIAQRLVWPWTNSVTA